MVEFKEWPKIPRGSGEQVTITEKIDGTNACVVVELDSVGELDVVGVQSRSHMLCEKDFPHDPWHISSENAGFGTWVRENEKELASLGEGYHYGEWAGPGIQKNHHNLEKKTFFLFNSDRWRDGRQQRPQCCECVPVLYEGPATIENIQITMDNLYEQSKIKGYIAEGIVCWYHKTRRYEKYTFENANGKWGGV